MGKRVMTDGWQEPAAEMAGNPSLIRLKRRLSSEIVIQHKRGAAMTEIKLVHAVMCACFGFGLMGGAFVSAVSAAPIAVLLVGFLFVMACVLITK